MHRLFLSILLMLFALPALPCDDPDAALSVGDKSKARVEYLKCLIEEQRTTIVTQGAAIKSMSDELSDTQRQSNMLQQDLDRLKDKLEVAIPGFQP